MEKEKISYVMLKSISNKTITFKICPADDIPRYYVKTGYNHGSFDVWATKSYLSRLTT